MRHVSTLLRFLDESNFTYNITIILKASKIFQSTSKTYLNYLLFQLKFPVLCVYAFYVEDDYDLLLKK